MAIEYGQGYEGRPGRPVPGEEQRRHRLPAVLRAPFEARTMRELCYQLLNLPMAILTFTYTVTALSLGLGLLITFIGLPLLAAAFAGLRGLGALERARARGILGFHIPAPAPAKGKKGPTGWMWALLSSGTSWRHALYSVIHLPWSVLGFTLSLNLWLYGWAMLTYPLWFWVFPAYVGQDGLQLYGDETHSVYLDNPLELGATAAAGLLLTLAAPWVIRGLTTVDKHLAYGLLGPSWLQKRVVELESDRGVVVDTAAADLRRIERDLHDGAQARLVALAMDLGLAKEKLLEDPEAAARMVDEAHGEVKTALQELRDLARGIHPAVLTDRGLDAALSSVASRCTVPVQVDVELPYRPAAAIEGIAYFTVSELLQNVSKHSRATRASIDVWRVENRLMLQVTDDGAGGADVSAGSGLAGLAQRMSAVDGILLVDSPPGGPTRVTAELPWRE